MLAPVIVLDLPLSDPALLAPFVEQCLHDEVELIAVTGPGCVAMEFEIDCLVVGDATLERYVTTSSHPDESFAETIEFASGWLTKRPGGVQVVSL